MTSKIIRNIALISMIILTATSAYCASDSEMKALAKKYLELDYKGAKFLTPGNRKEIAELEADPHKGVWDCEVYCTPPVRVVGSYTFEIVKNDKGEKFADIVFYSIGLLDHTGFWKGSGDGYKHNILIIREAFPFTTVNGKLKVDTKYIYPSTVSFDTAREYLKNINKEEDIKKLEKAIKNFNKYKDLVME